MGNSNSKISSGSQSKKKNTSSSSSSSPSSGAKNKTKANRIKTKKSAPTLSTGGSSTAPIIDVKGPSSPQRRVVSAPVDNSDFDNDDEQHLRPTPLYRTETAQSGKSLKSRQSQTSLRTSNGSILMKPNSRRGSSSRRGSNNNFNDSGLEPMTPILKKISTSNSFAYSESAITDDDEEEDTATTVTANVNTRLTPKMRANSSSSMTRRKKGLLKRHNSMHDDMIRSDPQSPNLSRPRSARKSENSGINPHLRDLLVSSSSNGNSHHGEDNLNSTSRRGSNSANASISGNTIYSTPIHTPNVDIHTREDSSEVDYFNLQAGSEHGDKAQYPRGLQFEQDTTLDHIGSANGSEAQIEEIPKKKKTVDIDSCIERLLDAGYAAKRTKNVCLKNYEITQICRMAREIFLSQPTLLELSPSVKIVGDVHGQYCDLLRLFAKCGFPPMSNYLFLGDYVDRGKQSLETILLLLCYKIKYPENFFLLRGNHECANVTRVYGFYDECKRRCNIKTWKHFIDTFNTLPLAAIVTGKIFCVHGGLSPVLNSMDEIRHVSRPTDVPDFGLVNDLLWSDPTDSVNEWEDNERGVSYCYNKVAINKFLNKFGFDLVCRAHMVVEDGYEFFNDRSLVTVFSAPNYCGEFDNWGAVMTVSDGLLCSFELLDPLDKNALKQVMKKGRQERRLLNNNRT